MSSLKTYTADSFDEVNQVDAPHSFYEQLFALQEISIKLSRATTLDELYKLAVESAIYQLGIDRLGILLIDYDRDFMLGTWGTDEKGNVRSETDFASPMDKEVIGVVLELSTRGKVCVWHDKEIYEFSEDQKDTSVIIGHGWNAAIGIWDKDKVIGWIACDNFLSQKPFEIYFTYILRLFGQLVGELVLKKKAEESVQALNNDLQTKNQVLESTIAELNNAQQQLVSAKIQASLKDVVVGVAHELNTPIGVATTAITSAQEKSVELKQKMDAQQLKKSDLDDAILYMNEASDLALRNLRTSNELIREFKRLSVFEHQDHQISQDLQCFDILQQAIEVTKLASPDFTKIKASIEISNDMPPLRVALEPIVQLLQDLLLNAYQHGDLNNDDRQLNIRSGRLGSHTYIDVINTNKSIDPTIREKIFDPFVTTGRSKGRVGLGLNVARNIATQVLGGNLALLEHESDTVFRITIPR